MMNLLKKRYVVRRINQGSIQNNGYYGGTKQDLVVYLNLQPYEDKTVTEDSGQTTVKRIHGFGKDLVRPVDQYNDTLADRVCFNGSWYICDAVENWTTGLPVDHYHSIWSLLPRNRQETSIKPEEVLV
jgi:hypothetical protein